MTQDTGDEFLVVSALHTLGMIRTDQWPMAASYLLVAGADGPKVLELAAQRADASGWLVDRLVEDVVVEANLVTLNPDEAGEIAAQLLGQNHASGDHRAIRVLAALAPSLDYPGGRIGEAYSLSEWLDCQCHIGSPERAAADAFEQELAALPPLNIPDGLAACLTDM